MQLKYQAVYDYINELINNQEPNTMIPSERVLSETLDISRMTVRKAIDIMVQEGKLYRKNNIGTFVSDNRLYKIYNTLTSFSDEVKSSGDIPGNIVLKFAKIPAPEKIATKLNIPKGELIY
jgi:DNA-binding GntR family transcriptional regulator